MSSDPKDRLIGRMREQYAQNNGSEPTGKVAREIEKKARESCERVSNRQVRWSPSGRK
jgi:hypothetical protein